MNEKFTGVLTQIDRMDWPPNIHDRIVEVWRSRDFLVQIFNEKFGIERLSINMTTTDGERWLDGISWDDLQRLKRECGRGDKWAVECFPSDRDIVNVANMRHLWVLPEPPPFGWRQ